LRGKCGALDGHFPALKNMPFFLNYFSKVPVSVEMG
jgi:hypothetical protein